MLRFVSQEVKKMKRNEPNIFDYGKPNQRSYPLKNFCALRSLKQYAQYEQEVVVADGIVAQERNPRTISTRRMILANYGGRCALTGIDIPQLLLASHIIPWADKSHKKDRLNPCNGICLSALYDKAFDQGLITISPDGYCVILSFALQENETKAYYDKHFGCIKGQKLTLLTEYLPSREFLAYHRDKVFVGV